MRTKQRSGLICGVVAVAAAMLPALCVRAQDNQHLLPQKPAVNETSIVFAYAGDLWSIPRAGGDARRLTAGTGAETDPHFSPDGKWIAFTGEYDGNTDVYVIPAVGGVPRRLTTHAAPDEAVGWSPDGKQVLFRSPRESDSFYYRLFTVPMEGGGFPTRVPLPMASEGCYSPDGKQMAYVPLMQWQNAWKRYRGGQTKPVWIADLSDSSIQKLPRENSNDFCPMWVGSRVYFLSDRNGPVSLYSYDTGSRKVTQLLKNDGLDLKSASVGPGAIVYEQFGSLHLYDLKSGKAQDVPIHLADDLLEVRPHFVSVAGRVRNARLSPTGVRTVFEARGEILTVPADKGDARDLTNTPGIAERDPAWAPDGKSIAYFSDESGDYALHIRAQNGMGEVRKIALGDPPSFFYSPTWSPDSKKIAYADKRLNLWYLDLDKGAAPVRIDTDTYDSGPLTPVWAPDSRWITYTKQLRSHISAAFIYSLENAASTQVTDGLSDVRYVAFDKSGKYLYFTASTDIGLNLNGGDLSGTNRPVSRSVYAVVLRNDLPSPLSPESDEEKVSDKPAETKPAADMPKPEAKPEDKNVRIDFEGIGQRIIALPIPRRNYVDLRTGKDGMVYVAETAAVMINPEEFGRATLYLFDLSKRKVDRLADNIESLEISANGEKLLYQQGANWGITGATGPVQPGAGILKLAGAEVRVDPRAEWKQMYHEAWRIERDYFYDPHFHGLDLAATEAKYAPWLEGIASRSDLNYLFEEMLGEMTVGHMFVFGGEQPEARRVRGGLLGADYTLENGRYRFARVYNGENWNPELRAPLTQPGVNVKAGEYLLAVNGQDVTTADEVYRFFEGTAGKQVVLKVGPNPNGDGAREVTVVPVDSEQRLRNLAWIEDNRRLVDRLSGGRLAYVYVPDTAFDGFASFNRYYFSQADREGAIIDERFNGGGNLADYITDYLNRPMMARVMTREGDDWNEPVAAIYGPKAMLINEMAGSGGDYLPWTFRKAGIGPLIGKRTWGGLVGIGGFPPLMDGGMVMAPRMAVYGLKGEFEVENIGVPPDIEVEYDPKAWREGHDPQLERAVAEVMDQLKKSPQKVVKRPKYPNYHPKG